MHYKRRQKLTITVIVVGALMVATLLVLYALKQNINLFYTPTELRTATLPETAVVRLGGMVVKHSVVKEKGSLLVHFTLTDFKENVPVVYRGVLPTLFREGQGIVTRGHVSATGEFKADEVLAKHDANYMPKEVKLAIKKSLHETTA